MKSNEMISIFYFLSEKKEYKNTSNKCNMEVGSTQKKSGNYI